MSLLALDKTHSDDERRSTWGAWPRQLDDMHDEDVLLSAWTEPRADLLKPDHAKWVATERPLWRTREAPRFASLAHVVVDIASLDLSDKFALPAGQCTILLALSEGAQSEWERAIVELWELVEGVIQEPDGDTPPSRDTVAAIEQLIPTLRSLTRLPEFETHDDGGVTLRWRKKGEPRSFAMHFGARAIAAVYSQPLRGSGFGVELELRDVASVERLIQRDEIADLISK